MPKRFRLHLGLAAAALVALTTGATPVPALADSSASLTVPASVVFSDGLNVLDRVDVDVPSLPSPPAGSRYRVWLRSDDERAVQFIGELRAPAGGAATVGWNQPGAENLLAAFSEVAVAVEGTSDPGPAPAGPIVLVGRFDPAALPQVRRLFVRWPDSRYGSGSLVGLRRAAGLLQEQVTTLQQAAAAGDLALMQRKGEHIVNLIEGERGAAYGDQNRDGRVEDPGDGTGIIPYVDGAITQVRFIWAQVQDPKLAEQALALEVPLRSLLDSAAFVRDSALQVAHAGDLAQAQALAAPIASAADLMAAGIGRYGDASLAESAPAGDALPIYDRAHFLTSVPLTAPCAFVLGFGDLDAQLPEQVGLCVEDQRFTPEGDAEQGTTGGLLVWRKADNWTAFTDGYRTWVNGPEGLQVRLNTERFDWEAP